MERRWICSEQFSSSDSCSARGGHVILMSTSCCLSLKAVSLTNLNVKILWEIRVMLTWARGLYAESCVGTTPADPGAATIPFGIRRPNPLIINRFCNWSWVAGVTVSFGWAFLHSTFLFLIVWKWISQMRSTTSSKSIKTINQDEFSIFNRQSINAPSARLTKPKPRWRFVCWSISITASSTFPNWLKYAFTSSTDVSCDTPPTKIFFVLFAVFGRFFGVACFGSIFFPSSVWIGTFKTFSTASGSCFVNN